MYDIRDSCRLLCFCLLSNADSSYKFPGLQTPGRCDFEVDLCHWQNLTDDDFDWQRHTGDTPSLETGPMYDHSRGFRGGGTCNAWYNEYASEKKDELEGCLANSSFTTYLKTALRRRNLKIQQLPVIWICVWGNLRQGNHVIIVPSSFSKKAPPALKMCSVHTKTQIRLFQLPPVWRAFSKSSVFVTH